MVKHTRGDITIADVLFFFMMFITMTSATRIGNFIQLILSILIILYVMIKSRKIYLLGYFWGDIVFFSYIILQILTGVTEEKSATSSILTSIIRVTVFSFALYTYICYKGDIYKVAKNYILSVSIGAFWLFVLYFDTLRIMRFEANEIRGIFGYMGSTMIAWNLAIACFFLVYFFYERNKQEVLLVGGMMMLFTVIAGTRKTLILFLFSLIIMPLIKNSPGKKISIRTIIKTTILISIGCCIILFALFKIPILYNLIGSRIEAAILFSKNNDDASLRVRTLFVTQAMELFYERPILGWGMNYFQTNSFMNFYSHNNFTEILSGGGIVGFIIYYSKYIYVLCRIIGTRKILYKDYALLLLFFIMIIALEYWQVAYIYPNCFIPYITIMYMCLEKTLKISVNKGTVLLKNEKK